MLAGEVIEHAKTELASLIVSVPKEEGSLGFCVAYRKLDEVTIREPYPLQRINVCIDSFGDATVFSTLDANSGY